MRKIRTDLLQQVEALLTDKQGAVDALQAAKDAADRDRADLQAKLDALPWDYDKLLEICSKINASSTIKRLLGL